ncbi:polyprenyl synthetase family protein [Pyrobaculum neutrophilum]|uniref:Polyprenyl synthetase n=1 Tax=Pyrobaculum neutrophilum (strain DSM 2338 / JCM 9278 / NBRC 100436 / V24Sta) TaxID=444157 RepID=B1Y9N3_PYRNV|nr:polyprenyl synthetase family protein [Pyrobaculum neutrophilum]ACB40462.1 Polyprenyl synthetase [Pyrobaculum neutrophilum V24Sta]
MSVLPGEVLAALERVKTHLQNVGSDIRPQSLREAVRYYIERPGKLLRPLLLLTFSYTLDRRSVLDLRIIQAAAIVELLHVVSLLQDDVMDKHDERRGAKTPRALYGDGRSIVASDWLIAESIKRALQLGPDIVKYLADVAQRLSIGQALDLDGRYDEAAEFKTAPLIEASLVLPAMLLGRREILDSAKKLGQLLGVLYQYADDYSDEKIERREATELVDEVKRALSRLRETMGEAIAPFENLIRLLLERAASGDLTVARSLIT